MKIERTVADFIEDILTECERIDKFIKNVRFKDFVANDEKTFRSYQMS